MKKILLVLLLVAALSALLASCGGETTTATTTTTAPVTTTEDPRLVGAYDNPENHLTLPALKDVTVDSSAINKTIDNDIVSFLKSLGKTAYTALPEGTAAVSGNTVNIHYTGRAKDPSVTLSESNIKGMTNASDTAGYDLTLGSGAFIPGFEDQLIGAKKGDQVAVDVTFPENYGNEELNGLAVIFDVTVNEVYETKVTAENELTIYATYTLVGEEANSKLSAFLLQHKTTLDMKNLTAKFDTHFDASVIAEAMLGKNLLEEVTLTLTISKEDAATYGYDKELTLTAKLYIADVVIYPTELTDADVNTNTNGAYKTVAEYRQYLFDYYKVSATYDTLVEKAVYGEIPKDVFDALYEGYYAVSLKNQIGDITAMTPEELTEKLTETVKKTAEEFATKNALAEWKDKLLIAYLEKTASFTYTDAMYQEDLKELYDYYCEYEAYLLYYYGISTMADFEALFDSSYGAGYLRSQLKNDALLTKISELVSYS